MDLKRKIARLRGAPAPAPAERDPDAEVAARVKAGLKARKTPSRTRVSVAVRERSGGAAGFAIDGEGLTATQAFDASHAHGAVALRSALDASPEAVARVALDPTLAGFDARRALFLDTETTGLAGGTGTLPFLVGLGGFEGERFVVTQHLVPEPGREGPALERVAARIEACGFIVSFNGKSFDLPLLRTRYAMSLMTAPPDRPHLDLLHVARRIYKSRVEQCRLVTLERDVLGFAREDDVASADVPALYQRFLRDGRLELLDGVARHNRWDIAALAALVGELCARADGLRAEGRFEAEDLLGIARTTWRAGDHRRAIALADALSSHPSLARDAHLLAAEAHRGQNAPEARVSRLREALALCPSDARLHLELARCLERDLSDPVSALAHAERSVGAEEPAKLARRISRLTRLARAMRAQQAQLRLPGIG